MKKFIYYIGILALCLLPAACSLEEESSTEVEKNKYMNDAKDGTRCTTWSIPFYYRRRNVWSSSIHLFL